MRGLDRLVRDRGWVVRYCAVFPVPGEQADAWERVEVIFSLKELSFIAVNCSSEDIWLNASSAQGCAGGCAGDEGVLTNGATNTQHL